MWFIYLVDKEKAESGIIINAFEKYCLENNLFATGLQVLYSYRISKEQKDQIMYTPTGERFKFIISSLANKTKEYVQSRLEYLDSLEYFPDSGLEPCLFRAIKNNEYFDFSKYYFHANHLILELSLLYGGEKILSRVFEEIKPNKLNLLLTLYNSNDLRLLPADVITSFHRENCFRKPRYPRC